MFVARLFHASSWPVSTRKLDEGPGNKVVGGQCSRERMEIVKKTQEVLSCKCPWLLAQGNAVYDVWTCGMSCSTPVVKAALITYYVYLVIRAANLNLFSLLLIVDLAMTTILTTVLL